ncbi:MAG TPA: hypothetical protein VFT69_18470 [Pseudolabrys sp.]|jgi:hypothetical protein|nr:hypothetical protein [Pseudolabrys sp.]
MAELDLHVRAYGDVAMAAINQLDTADADAAKKQLALVVERLAGMRDALIEARREGQACDEWLRRTNAILSSIFGTEFPLGGLQWKRVTETRAALGKLLQQPRVC